ncbi:hypothetical protein, partial [Escherichia coli]|uniref:hypothetical protein n=1 Tax=Escherichia coli TaxID=562 RepID=UPI003458C267
MLTLQVHWLAEKPDGKGSRSPFAIFPVRTVLPDTLIHEPDWHGGQCQSGIWTTTKMNFTTSTYNIGKNTRNLSIGVHAYCSWTYLNGSPFGGFQQIYADQNKVWYVNNYAWGNYESGGTITVTCLNQPS